VEGCSPLVIQHYGSKNDLFAIATRLDRGRTDDDVVEHLFDVLDVRLNEAPPETRALVRSMLTALTDISEPRIEIVLRELSGRPLLR
jgi:hypothetical protein